jgi:hypothetical protein
LSWFHQAQAQLLVERNTVQSLSAHYEDLKAAQTHLNNSYNQQQATITRLREDLDRVSCTQYLWLTCRLHFNQALAVDQVWGVPPRDEDIQ